MPGVVDFSTYTKHPLLLFSAAFVLHKIKKHFLLRLRKLAPHLTLNKYPQVFPYERHLTFKHTHSKRGIERALLID